MVLPSSLVLSLRVVWIYPSLRALFHPPRPSARRDERFAQASTALQCSHQACSFAPSLTASRVALMIVRPQRGSISVWSFRACSCSLLLRALSHPPTLAAPRRVPFRNERRFNDPSKLACSFQGAAWISPNVRACRSTAYLAIRWIWCAPFASTRTDQADLSLSGVRVGEQRRSTALMSAYVSIISNRASNS